jgi:glucokinase
LAARTLDRLVEVICWKYVRSIVSIHNSVVQPTSRMRKPFVLISGLPGSGKTTLGRRLAPALNLPLIDKDDILDRLFESKGVGNGAWRRTLSRESDVILQQEATKSNGAILASFWRSPGMRSDSGTPTDWLNAPSHHVVNVHCVCELEVAASRFLQRRRHPGNLDDESSSTQISRSLGKLTQLPPLEIGQRIDVDTSDEPNLTEVVRAIRGALGLLT